MIEVAGHQVPDGTVFPAGTSIGGDGQGMAFGPGSGVMIVPEPHAVLADMAIENWRLTQQVAMLSAQLKRVSETLAAKQYAEDFPPPGPAASPDVSGETASADAPDLTQQALGA